MTQAPKLKTKKYICKSPEETFKLGEKIGESLNGGEMILLKGTLGAGKTLLTKGIVNSLEFDIDEVTSPSFTLVNLYKAEKFEVYHIDLWRIDEKSDAVFAVGVNEILENKNAVIIIEWAERLKNFTFPEKTLIVKMEGDGDDPRIISISEKL
ncbi:MAG: tRNA (adenosine(37)-N6)-threonylcarbamoyltransferase complex ATPase subunit type 1 TsaE [Acidobacteriota bacterium]|jgi:tRNA threonylcarbamoyladenosine biosynthesis protein TsaE|nr:tRNA (adenosine(37)-N6)-threonylcarbamoyltransferase complex ATPase subunit type 1 TsaE [Acidobacteriota bacterium]